MTGLVVALAEVVGAAAGLVAGAGAGAGAGASDAMTHVDSARSTTGNPDFMKNPPGCSDTSYVATVAQSLIEFVAPESVAQVRASNGRIVDDLARRAFLKH